MTAPRPAVAAPRPAVGRSCVIPYVVLNNTWTMSEFSKAARVAAGLNPRDTRPVRVVRGRAAPTVVGEAYYHTTPGGDVVHNVGAYRKAYGRPVYIPSTRAVVVGAQWSPLGGGAK